MDTNTQTEEISAIEEVEKKKKNWKKEVLSWVYIIVGVMAFRSVFFEPFKIPSGSMIPTLLIGDYIVVNKFSYGFKVPFSHLFSDSPSYITEQELPERGDVIVFKYPVKPSLNYIKRVVGLPGDTIEVVDKVVYLNGQPIDKRAINGEEFMEDMDEKFKYFNFKFYENKLGNHTFVSQIDLDNAAYGNYYKRRVPADHVFVMGDNRDYSADSRRWGFVPKGNIKGRAVAIWFSMNIPWWWEDTGEFTFRPWRIFKAIN